MNMYVLTPGRYVGGEDVVQEGNLEGKVRELVKQLYQQFDESAQLEATIREGMRRLGHGI